MIMNQIKTDMVAARKAGDKIKGSLLTTLYSEAQMVGKNDGNRETNDSEVVAVIKKFIKNASDNVLLLQNNSDHDSHIENEITKYNDEIRIINKYIPSQLSEEDLESIISDIIEEKQVGSVKAMGMVMQVLKERHGGTYDGKMASALVKELLN